MTQVPEDTGDRFEAACGVTADETSPDGGDRVGGRAGRRRGGRHQRQAAHRAWDTVRGRRCSPWAPSHWSW